MIAKSLVGIALVSSLVFQNVSSVNSSNNFSKVINPRHEIGIKISEIFANEQLQEEVVQAVLSEPIPEPEPEPQVISLGTFKITAYCPCSICNGSWSNGITSTGVTAQSNRTIAVDPKVIPYGTVVEINGQQYVAEDCGGAIKNNRIDVFFNTHQEALNFGVQYHEVLIKK